jgi:hypothetical protein
MFTPQANMHLNSFGQKQKLLGTCNSLSQKHFITKAGGPFLKEFEITDVLMPIYTHFKRKFVGPSVGP